LFPDNAKIVFYEKVVRRLLNVV